MALPNGRCQKQTYIALSNSLIKLSVIVVLVMVQYTSILSAIKLITTKFRPCRAEILSARSKVLCDANCHVSSKEADPEHCDPGSASAISNYTLARENILFDVYINLHDTELLEIV